ncbi:MAG TPA: histidinol-phosphate transaminase [Methanomicrobiales archaeon]|nr:histidinol-phosphate transaminase [Methanomicrobiales archaeon]
MKKELPERVVHGGTFLWHQGRSGIPLLDFSANLNPFPPDISWSPDPSVLASYPDDRYEALRETIGRTFHRSPEEVAVGNGSMEIIRVFCQAAFSPGDHFLADQPTFGEYDLSARLAGALPVSEPGRARVRFLCNPNNPTGALLPADRVRGILPQVRAGPGILFLDEAFIELSDPGQSLIRERDPALFLLRSLTKAFAVPGLRFGYGFGDPDLVARMEVIRSPWSVNAFAEDFALLAFRYYDRLEESRQRITRERTWLEEKLRVLGLAPSPSKANFLLVPLKMQASSLTARLLEKGILVRDCTSFGLPDAIRIAVRKREENERLIEALTACLR